MDIPFVIRNKVALSAPLWHENVNEVSKDGQKYSIKYERNLC